MYLGNPAYRELFEELDKREAKVFIHPTDPSSYPKLSMDMLNFLMEVTFDTTRTVIDMAFNGVIDKYKKISFILAHGGGTLPYLSWRLSMVRGPKMTITNLLKKMYYDTALVGSNHALNCLYQFANKKHILFGTDYPFGTEFAAKMVACSIQNNNQFYFE